VTDIARLTKRDVEDLLTTYDHDPVAALTPALCKVLDAAPGTPWDDLLALAPIRPERRAALARLDAEALDDLVRQLNEERTLDAGR
jgi:hypothetical protein